MLCSHFILTSGVSDRLLFAHPPLVVRERPLGRRGGVDCILPSATSRDSGRWRLALLHRRSRSLTFRKQARASIGHVPSQEPSIAEVIVPLDQFYAIALGETQLIRAPCDEVVDYQ